MNYSLDTALPILERTPAVLSTLLSGLPDEWTRATEGPDTWSPYDVIGHLLHGEHSNWVTRVGAILSQDETRSFAPFDRFAQFRESEGKTLSQLLQEFSAARQKSLNWLREQHISASQLELEGIHPAFGTVTLAQLLATWVVHDLDHITQVVRVMAKQYDNAVGPWKEYLRVLRS
jgi:uncharacterized damage-inducible protein DinB